MAEVVAYPPRAWSPVESLFTVYLAAGALLIAIAFRPIPEALALLAAHAVAIALLAVAPRLGGAWRKPASLFRYWFPLALIPICYKEMAILIAAIRRTDLDAQVARLDYSLWGTNVTVWLERWQNPWITELLQLAYTLYIPSLVLVAVVLWAKGLYPDFRYCQQSQGHPDYFNLYQSGCDCWDRWQNENLHLPRLLH